MPELGGDSAGAFGHPGGGEPVAGEVTMRMPEDAISETAMLRLLRKLRRIELREAGPNVVDLMREREARVVRDEIALGPPDSFDPKAG